MSCERRIAFLLGRFPLISETFILRQITGILDLGHGVRIFSNDKPETSEPRHSEVEKYRLLERTTYIGGPKESTVWEQPLRPLSGKTWAPGAIKPTPNWQRFLTALPALGYCLWRAPKLARSVLNRDEYRYQADSWSGIFRLAALGRSSGGFDVLHAHFGQVGNCFRFARELWRAPLVVSFHGHDFSTLPRKEGPSMYQNLFRTADLVTVNSEFTRSQVEKLGCPVGRMRLLPVGLDLKEFKFRERTLSPRETVGLITVARLTEIKGHETVLRAIAAMPKTERCLRYDIVGDGPLRKRLENMVAELGLNESVFFHGALRGGEISELLDRAHIFLLCSVNVEGDMEGQGLALQEAQACGLPVIATSHGALPEGLVQGRSGYLVAERDQASLVNCLNHLMENCAEWPAMGRAGRNFVESKYDIRKLNDQLLAIYTEAIEVFRTHS